MMMATNLQQRSVVVANGRRVVRDLVHKRSSATTTAYYVPLTRPPPSSSSTFLRHPFRWYSRRLDTHPISTKCASAGLIAVSGNLLAQKIAHEQNGREKQQQQQEEFRIDWTAVGRFAFLNVAYVAPVLHHWYQFVNRAFPGKTLRAVWTRVFWDEFVFTPMYLPVFMGGLWSLEGTEWKRVKQMLWNEMPNIIAADIVLWVPTMFLTFRYSPVKYQVLVINTVGVVWQTFLSLTAQQAQHHHHHQTNHSDGGGHHHHHHHHHDPVHVVIQTKPKAPAPVTAAAAPAAPPKDVTLIVTDAELDATELYGNYFEFHSS